MFHFFCVSNSLLSQEHTRPFLKMTFTVLSKFDSDYRFISETHIHFTTSGRHKASDGNEEAGIPMLDYNTATRVQEGRTFPPIFNDVIMQIQ